MPKITDVKVQKKRKERVSVFLDGKFWTGMSQGCYLELGIENGQVLSNEEVASVEERVISDSAMAYALNRLGYGMISEAKLKEKIIEREYSEQIADAVVTQCRDLALLDDAYYAELLTSSQKEKGMGRRRAEQKLAEKGIPKAIADRAIEEAFPEDDTFELAVRSLQMRYGTDPLDRRAQQRAMGFLTRRGFNPGVAQAAIAGQALSEEDESELHGPDEARDVLVRRYGSADLDRDTQRKAYGFLARRGYTSSVISRALAGVE